MAEGTDRARRLVRRLPLWAMPAVRVAWCAAHDVADRVHPPEVRGPLPPARLRYLVGGIDARDYVAIGSRCVADIEAALADHGESLRSLRRVLDFGCGTGRVTAGLIDRCDEVTGVDRHAGCVAWCRGHLPGGTFEVVHPLPPLPFPTAAFDLVIATSVFTHLRRGVQERWIAELARVVRPGGVVLASVCGDGCLDELDGDERARLERDGFVDRPARGLHHVHGDYVDTVQTSRFAHDAWSAHLDLVEQRPRGLNDHQDLLVLRGRG